ncbi:hypothetical protein AALP_AAs40879U000100 [Arabis alpina]|uniref:Uncharacterized protein n=1 Tax=Arabis alpina TaxID=50452 RepID=A0A087FWG5_ARAAL|nr:hypothetical protein AALP_AAs40879U000100 [Arabis alpina]
MCPVHPTRRLLSICHLFEPYQITLREKHEKEIENLTLTTQPFNTLKLFVEATILYIKRSISYLLAHGV